MTNCYRVPTKNLKTLIAVLLFCVLITTCLLISAIDQFVPEPDPTPVVASVVASEAAEPSLTLGEFLREQPTVTVFEGLIPYQVKLIQGQGTFFTVNIDDLPEQIFLPSPNYRTGSILRDNTNATLTLYYASEPLELPSEFAIYGSQMYGYCYAEQIPVLGSENHV